MTSKKFSIPANCAKLMLMYCHSHTRLQRQYFRLNALDEYGNVMVCPLTSQYHAHVSQSYPQAAWKELYFSRVLCVFFFRSKFSVFHRFFGENLNLNIRHSGSIIRAVKVEKIGS